MGHLSYSSQYYFLVTKRKNYCGNISWINKSYVKQCCLNKLVLSYPTFINLLIT